MKKNVIAGFNITCIGDDRSYSYLASRYGDTLADRVALHVLKNMKPDFVKYSYLNRGSDERQYCSPGIDLPVASVMRTKYGQYPEYHTSLDNLKLITPAGLLGGYEVLKACIDCIENNEKLAVTVLCEPQLEKRGLYPTLSTKKSVRKVKDMMNLIAYSDGKNDLIEIAEIINVPMWKLYPVIAILKEKSLLKVIE
jgi:aminopeptidase-like protein